MNLNQGTVGITGTAVRNEGLVDIPGVSCNKHGQEGLKATLIKVGLNSKHNFNLLSLTRLMQDGWSMSGNKDGTVRKNEMEIKFDIVIPANQGAVYAECFKQTCEIGKAAMARTIPINMTKVHALLGHWDENATRQSAAALGWIITRGKIKPCKNWAKGKARKRNVYKKSTGQKATVPNG